MTSDTSCKLHMCFVQGTLWPRIPASFNMYLVINKCVTAVKVSNFSGHYLHNHSTLDIGVLGYISILYHKGHPPEVWHIPPGTPVYMILCNNSTWLLLAGFLFIVCTILALTCYAKVDVQI
jgi:hypothetical protein